MGRTKQKKEDGTKSSHSDRPDSNRGSGIGNKTNVHGNESKRKNDTEQTVDYQLEEFDYDKVEPDSSILVIGKRRYGKSTWARYLLSKIWKFYLDGAFVFTATKHNWFWQQHIPDTRIYEGIQPDAIKEILEVQKEKYQRYLDGDYDQCPYIVIIFDDVISDERDLRFTPELNELIFSGRHFFVTCIFCIQDAHGVGPKFRNNADLVALTYQTQLRSIDSVMKDYAKHVANPKEFENLLDQNTQDYQMVIVDQTRAKYDLKEIFFKTLAEEDPEPFKLGSDEFWEESGCSWEDQLMKAKKRPKRKLEDWQKLAEQKYKEMLKHKKEMDNEEVDEMLWTNNPTSVGPGPPPPKPPPDRSKRLQEILNLKLKYVPGPRNEEILRTHTPKALRKILKY